MTQGEEDERTWYQQHSCLRDKMLHLQAADMAEPVEYHVMYHVM